MHLSQIVNYDVYRSVFHKFVENLCRALSRNPYRHKVMFYFSLSLLNDDGKVQDSACSGQGALRCTVSPEDSIC